MRAIQPRTTRYDSRTLRRNHCVTSTISGSTENATSASRQSIHSITTMMPTQREHVAEDVTTPDVNRSFSTSTSRGDARHQPADRVAVVVAQVEPLQVAVDAPSAGRT